MVSPGFLRRSLNPAQFGLTPFFFRVTTRMHELETYTAPDVVKIVVGNKVDKVRSSSSPYHGLYLKPVRLTRVPPPVVSRSPGVLPSSDDLGRQGVRRSNRLPLRRCVPRLSYFTLNLCSGRADFVSVAFDRGVRQDAHRSQGGLRGACHLCQSRIGSLSYLTSRADSPVVMPADHRHPLSLRQACHPTRRRQLADCQAHGRRPGGPRRMGRRILCLLA